jgi:FAD/FMN-containing dehydrogenase
VDLAEGMRRSVRWCAANGVPIAPRKDGTRKDSR